jgi:hypothetical protein
MTALSSFSAACKALLFQTRGQKSALVLPAFRSLPTDLCLAEIVYRRWSSTCEAKTGGLRLGEIALLSIRGSPLLAEGRAETGLLPDRGR